MGDFKSLPPRQADFRINLNYKDLASLLIQAANNTEVLTFLTNEQLQHAIFDLQTEQQGRMPDEPKQPT